MLAGLRSIRSIRLPFPGLIVLTLLSAGGWAQVINFGALTDTGTITTVAGFNYYSLGPSITYQGFNFALGSGPFGTDLGTWSAGDSLNHPVGGDVATSLLSFYADNVITVSSANSIAFDVDSIDLASWAGAQSKFGDLLTVTFQGTRVDNSTVDQTVSVENSSGQPVLQTATLTGFTDLTDFSFTQGEYDNSTAKNSWQFNNLNITQVPEPSSLTILAVGLLAGLRRRKRR